MKRSLLIFSLLFCLLSPTALQSSQSSQRQAAKPTTAAAPATARLPEAKLISHVLANGLEIIVLEDHSIPLVTLSLAVKNGSYTEPPELNGLSHLYEHMFFKQNRAIANAEDYLQAIGKLGIAYTEQHEKKSSNTTSRQPVQIFVLRCSS